MNRLIQHLTLVVFSTRIPVKAFVAMTGILAFCCSVCAATEPVDQLNAFRYQSQQNLFDRGQSIQPFLVDQSRTQSASTATTRSEDVASSYSLPLMSISSGKEADDLATTTQTTQPTNSTQGFTPPSQPSITELTDTLQWTILLLTAAAAIVIGIHRFTKNKHQTERNLRMEYQGSLPIRGQFSMHLVRIVDRQFLVTTDRSGVKTVNALNEWDQFTAPIDLSGDDDFPEPQMDSKPLHHG